jgi:hypothetical protein
VGKADHQLQGYEIFWFSNDHDPPHFNVEKRGHWRIKVHFTLSTDDHLEFKAIWQNQKRILSGKEQKLLCKYIKINRVHLLDEWERKVHRDENRSD